MTDNSAIIAAISAHDDALSTVPSDAPNKSALATRHHELENLQAQISRTGFGWRHDALVVEARQLSDALEADITATKEARSDVGLRPALHRALMSDPGTGFTYSVRSLTVDVDAQGGNAVRSIGSLPELHNAIAGHQGGVLSAVRQIITPVAGTSPGISVSTITSDIDPAAYDEEDAIAVGDATLGKVDISLTKRAVISKVSRTVIEDSSFDVVEVISEAQALGHRRRSENAIIAAILAAAGTLVTDAAPSLTAIQTAVGQVLIAGHKPDVALVSPTDYAAMRVSAGIAAHEIEDAMGVRLVPSTSVAAGTAIVAEGRHIVFGRRDLVPVNISTGADFLADIVSVRSVIRSGSAVIVPDAVAVVAVV